MRHRFQNLRYPLLPQSTLVVSLCAVRAEGEVGGLGPRPPGTPAPGEGSLHKAFQDGTPATPTPGNTGSRPCLAQLGPWWGHGPFAPAPQMGTDHVREGGDMGSCPSGGWPVLVPSGPVILVVTVIGRAVEGRVWPEAPKLPARHGPICLFPHGQTPPRRPLWMMRPSPMAWSSAAQLWAACASQDPAVPSPSWPPRALVNLRVETEMGSGTPHGYRNRPLPSTPVSFY